MKRYIVSAVMCVMTLATMAQEAKVKNFRPNPADLTAQKYYRNDRNGVKCAVVKVQVIAENVHFQGGIIEPVEKKPGEYWVYMPGMEQRVLVLSDTFKPLMVEFEEPLEAGMTYLLTLEVPQNSGIIDGDENFFEAYKDDNDKWGFKCYGRIIIPAKYDSVRHFSEGLSAVLEDGKYGFINNRGNMAIPAKYDDAREFSEGMSGVRLSGKWGFIDKSGNLVIPAKYEHAGSFSEGMAAVFLNGKCGYLDKTGKMVIPAKYDGTKGFNEGLADVKLNGKRGFIDKRGSLVIPAKYDDVEFFSEGLAGVKLNGKWGYIDKSGKMVIPNKYDIASSFENGEAKVYLNDRLLEIDKNGNETESLLNFE